MHQEYFESACKKAGIHDHIEKYFSLDMFKETQHQIKLLKMALVCFEAVEDNIHVHIDGNASSIEKMKNEIKQRELALIAYRLGGNPIAPWCV